MCVCITDNNVYYIACKVYISIYKKCVNHGNVPQLMIRSTKWYIHTMEYYLAMKRNGVLIHATTWMKLENIMLSERNQPHIGMKCSEKANQWRHKDMTGWL